MNSLFRNKFVLLFNCIFLFILCSICVVANDEKLLENVKISMSTDSKYVYPTIVSITSIMENSKKDIDYEFYILLSGNVNKNLKGKIMFYMFRKMQSSSDAAWNPKDRDWWIEQGWIENVRPWK